MTDDGRVQNASGSNGEPLPARTRRVWIVVAILTVAVSIIIAVAFSSKQQPTSKVDPAFWRGRSFDHVAWCRKGAAADGTRRSMVFDLLRTVGRTNATSDEIERTLGPGEEADLGGISGDFLNNKRGYRIGDGIDSSRQIWFLFDPESMRLKSAFTLSDERRDVDSFGDVKRDISPGMSVDGVVRVLGEPHEINLDADGCLEFLYQTGGSWFSSPGGVSVHFKNDVVIEVRQWEPLF